MKRLSVIIIGILVSLNVAYGQKIVAATGEATIRLEENLSREETRDRARELAKQNAIESAFGTFMAKDGYVDVADGESAVILKSQSQLKGEWLKTTDEVFTENTRKIKDEYGRRNEIWITCTIEGKIREITSPLVSFEFQALNCPDDRCRTTDFENGESFFLKFTTPVDGYLSVYMADEENAYRILPYQEMPAEYVQNVPVQADKDYIFFAYGYQYDYFEGFPYYLVDEIYLDTEREQEFYKLYVLFSTKPFSKPILEEDSKDQGEYMTPKTLRRRNFDVWVQDNRIFDTDFYYQTLNVRVRK